MKQTARAAIGRLAWLVMVATASACIGSVAAADGATNAPNAETGPVRAGPRKPAGESIFGRPTVVRVQVDLDAANLKALRENPRDYASATVRIDDREFTKVGVRLKGAAGSFRPVDDRPAMTLKFNKWLSGGRWDSLRQVHLNNSVQDPTYMSEYLAGELFRAAGVPATRVAWARASLNGRDLGTYVIKEGFEEEFLRRYFDDAGGNLYDGGFVQDIDQDIERSRGTGPVDRADLKALVAAARESNPARRWERLQQRLDVDRFVSYAVVSAMIADWDGYAMNRNNYRVYFNPADGRAVFFPHGTDQLFQRNEIGVEPYWNGLVAQGLFSLPQAQKLYRDRFVQVFTNVFRAERMTNLLDQAGRALKAGLPGIESRVKWASMTVQSRVHSLEQDPALRGLVPGTTPVVRIPKEGLQISDWEPQPAGGAARFAETETGAIKSLRITANGSGSPSFRSTVRLPRGRYRFEGRVRTIGVESVRDEKGEGAGLRISGSDQPRRNHLSGDKGWTVLAYDFELASVETEITLVAELRASRGMAEFDRGSLRVLPME